MIPSLNLVFCGTPRFAVPTLDRLVEAGFHVQLVVTRPDHPKGRGLELVPSPVKQRATQLGLPITQPEGIKNNDAFHAQLTTLNPDAIIVVGYGRIIPQWMFDLPRLGNINLHASLLPKYRGAAPIQWAIARGETVTGVTTMKIDAGLDTGDILLQEEVPIASDDTAETLAPRLAAVGADLTVTTLRGLQNGAVQPHQQNQSQATLAPILKKEDGRIDFTSPATEIRNRMRGFQPWPGAYTNYRGKKMQVWKAAVLDRPLAPAELMVDGERLLAGCGSGTAIELIELQLEGKKRTSAADFVRGHRPLPGEKLGA
ncbi:MAG TPA: methionyl-tRNA formyltransferase [Candidatus Dormibacteraeota bacterium]|jgi:methionyl-tRNA formyltransferase|nr:methionyl-tRNA formyltransferase [Candidatus Dormibacteraeota bacterium]